MKKLILVTLIALFTFACATKTPDPTDDGTTTTTKKVKVKATKIKVDESSISVTGDFSLSGSLSLDADGKLVLSMPAIKDPDDVTKPIDPSKATFVVYVDDSEFTCDIAKTSSTSTAKVDLVTLIDSTGSMSGTLTGLKNSVNSFADKLVADGIDAQFGGFAYGDEYSTAWGTPSVGNAEYKPDTMDSTDRPFIDLSLVDIFKSFVNTLYASGGGDGPENTIGTLNYAYNKTNWRDGAMKVFLVTGDNLSHQEGTWAELDASTYAPHKGLDAANNFKGKATIHVIGTKYTDTYGYFDNKTLADVTGGQFFELPYDGKVDLNKINFSDWITNSFTGSCSDDFLVGATTVKVVVTIEGSKVYTATITLTLSAE